MTDDDFSTPFSAKICPLGQNPRRVGTQITLSPDGVWELAPNAPLLDRTTFLEGLEAGPYHRHAVGKLDSITTGPDDGQMWLYAHGHATAEAAAQLTSGEKQPSASMDQMTFANGMWIVTSARIRSVLLIPKETP